VLQRIPGVHPGRLQATRPRTSQPGV